MFTQEARNEIETVAARIAVEPAALLAIAEVESAGRVFARVEGRKEPLIRFEGHYFDRRLPAEKREAARAAGLADPKAGAVKNPSAQAARWAMLERAAAIDHKAAHESVSWGLGQVMGAHWDWLGYPHVDALVAEARAGVGGQVALMARYIEKAGLAAAIRRRDWAAFARGYNGPDYRRHGYDTKIAAAYARHAAGGAAPPAPQAAEADGPLRRGATGSSVLALQSLLAAAGQPVAQDGVYGAQTETAVRLFQRIRGLDIDGIAGPRTLEALRAAGSAPAADDPSPSWLPRWLAGLWRRG